MQQDLILTSSEVPAVANMFDGLSNWSNISNYKATLDLMKDPQDKIIIDTLSQYDIKRITTPTIALGSISFMRQPELVEISKKTIDQHMK